MGFCCTYENGMLKVRLSNNAGTLDVDMTLYLLEEYIMQTFIGNYMNMTVQQVAFWAAQTGNLDMLRAVFMTGQVTTDELVMVTNSFAEFEETTSPLTYELIGLEKYDMVQVLFASPFNFPYDLKKWSAEKLERKLHFEFRNHLQIAEKKLDELNALAKEQGSITVELSERIFKCEEFLAWLAENMEEKKLDVA